MRGTLVIGGLPRIVVPVARSLHARGIPVHGASVGLAGRKIRSRALRSFTCLGSEENPEELFERLRQTIAGRDIDTVIPCGDEVIQSLAPHYEKLQQLVHYCGPTLTACRTILQKRETLAIASSIGVPVPAEYQIANSVVLAEMRSSLRFPVVVKPKNKEAEAITGIKSEIAYSFEELSAHFERFPEFGDWFLIQEYLPGFGVAVEILMDRGEPVTAFQHRRVREYPVRGGVSVVAVSEAPDPEIVAYGVALLRALDWRGVAMVEFRKNSATGRLGLMEVNGRFWGSLALSLFCGIDFPWYVWQQAHGRRPAPPASYPAGIRFRWLAGDVKRLYECLTTSFKEATRGAKHFVQSFPPGAMDATWSWRDPLPAVEELARSVAAVGLMAIGALSRNVIPGSAYRRLKALRRAGASRAIRYLERRFVSRPGQCLDRVEPVHSVVFVCHGNIIRSPMAAALFRAAELGIRVDSAGTAAIPGRDVDARAAQIAREFGVSLEGHTASRVTAAMVDDADLLVVMDYLNYISLLDNFPTAAGKTVLLAAGNKGSMEIDDPYEGSLDDIRAAYRKLQHSTETLLTRLAYK